MKVIVFTNARDEPHILEWISHYLNLGFDHVFIYDHQSKIPISSLIAPKNISLVNRITITRLDDNIRNMKSTLMTRALDISKEKGFDWMLYIDADEFLYLKNNDNIKTFLEHYKGYHQVGINWLMFGTNFMNIEVEGTLLEKYTRSASELNRHIKSFVKPRYAKKPMNPHVYHMRGSCSIHCENKPLGPDPYFFETTTLPIDVTAYFAHYIHQAHDVYIKRKIALPRDDNGKFRIQLTETELHQRNNEIITIDMLKYNEENKRMISVLNGSDDMFDYIYNENQPNEVDTIAMEIIDNILDSIDPLKKSIKNIPIGV
jgi:hypothetical protein